jgi:hypothetical protein
VTRSFLWATNSTFTDIGANLGSAYTDSAKWVDYDADGRLDVSVVGCLDPECSSYGVKLYRNGGHGSFSVVANTGLPEFWEGVVSWTDYDSDGYVDALVTAVFEPVLDVSTLISLDIDSKLYRNNGDGTFSENAAAGLGGVLPIIGDQAISSVDYNNDGRLDIVLTGINTAALVAATISLPPYVTKLYRNNGDGTFSEVANTGLPNDLYAVGGWSDYDLDGYIDVLFNGCADLDCSTYANKLYRNNGNGTFSENTSAALPDLAGWTVWGDFNGDALPDIVLSGTNGPFLTNVTDVPSPTNVTKLYRNNGDGTFSESTNAGLPDLGNTLIVSGDFNSDGSLDVLLNGYDDSYSDYVTEIYNNNGNGSFSLDTSAGLPDTYAWLAPGDYDTDGRLDLLIWDLDMGYGPAAVYRNEGAAASAPPAPPTGLKARLVGERQITFSWDAGSSETPMGSLSYNLRVGTTRGGSDIVSPMSTASGARSVVGFGNAEGKMFATVQMPRDGVYYWSVQAVSPGFLGSTFAQDERFVLPPFITIKRPGRINACGARPLSTTVRGSIGRVFPSATVFLQRRFTRHSSWKKLALTRTDARGGYSFRNVGKGSKRSFWIRAVSAPDAANNLVSGSRRVVVKRGSACEKTKK